MLSLQDFERCVNINNEQAEQEYKMKKEKEIEKEREKEKNEQIPEYKSIFAVNDRTTGKEFFSSYHNRLVLYIISSYLTDFEKIKLLYLNKFTLANLKKIFQYTKFKDLKERMITLFKKGHTLEVLLSKDAKKINKIIKISEFYERKEDVSAAYLLIGKWLNSKYLVKKTKIIDENGKEKTVKTGNNYLVMKSVNISDKSAIYLFSIIAHNHFIEDLDIANNYITDIGIVYFQRAFSKPRNLKRLNIDNNNFGNKNGMSYFVKTFEFINNLTLLNICNTGINENSAVILSKHLSKLANIETIYIDNNDLCSLGAGLLLESLHESQNLKFLSMSNVSIKNDFAPYFKKFIQRPYSIYKLVLNNNQFNSSFFNTAGNLNSMKIIDLEMENCFIDNDALKVFFNKLMCNKYLTGLNLNKNEFFGSDSIIKKFLEENHVLKLLYIIPFHSILVPQEYHKIFYTNLRNLMTDRIKM